MQLQPPEEVERWLRDEVASGRYASIEAAAVAALERQAEWAAMDEIMESSGVGREQLETSITLEVVDPSRLIDRKTAHAEAWRVFNEVIKAKP